MSLDATDRLAVAMWITRKEMRVDSAGNPRVYDLPANDGGGRYEVAGINEKYHPKEAAELAALVRSKQYSATWRRAAEIIAVYTDVVPKWGLNLPDSIEVFARDCAFNRGPGGCAKIFQIALCIDPDGDDDGEPGPIIHVVPDGAIGKISKAAFVEIRGERDFLIRLRLARELYELRVAGKRANLWDGLVNRWDACLAFSLSYAAKEVR